MTYKRLSYSTSATTMRFTDNSGCSILSFPRSGARRYTQVPPSKKRRHSGRDCRNPEAMEGKLFAEKVFDSGNFQLAVSHPCGLDSGNPCRNDWLLVPVCNTASDPAS